MNLNRIRPSNAIGLWLLSAAAGASAADGAVVAASGPAQKPEDDSDAPPDSEPGDSGESAPSSEELDSPPDSDAPPGSAPDSDATPPSSGTMSARALEAADVDGMPGAVCFGALASFASDAEPPSEFKILDRGETRMRKGGRMFNVLFDEESEEKCGAAMKAKAQDTLPLDYDHGMLGMIATPDSSAAAGWFSMEVRKDGLYAAGIEWTERALKAIRQREYRYTSPAIMLEQTDEEGTSRCVELVNVALTNLPATVGQKALVANAKQEQKDMKITKELLAKLGLKDGAGEAEVEAKLTELAIKASSTDAANASADAARAAVEAAKVEAVKLSEKAIIADQLSARVQTLEAERAAAQHAAIFGAGKSAGKISPSLEAWAKAQSADQLAAFLKDAPTLLGGRVLPAGDPSAPKGPEAVDEVEQQVCKLLNLQPKKFARQRARLAEMASTGGIDAAVPLPSRPAVDPYFSAFRGVRA